MEWVNIAAIWKLHGKKIGTNHFTSAKEERTHFKCFEVCFLSCIIIKNISCEFGLKIIKVENCVKNDEKQAIF